MSAVGMRFVSVELVPIRAPPPIASEYMKSRRLTAKAES
jgi:hypothetical protein